MPARRSRSGSRRRIRAELRAKRKGRDFSMGMLDSSALRAELPASDVQQGQLIASRCPACERLTFPPRSLCPNCWSQTRILPLQGTGTLETFTVIWRGKTPVPPPYAVGSVALDERLRILLPIVAKDLSDLRVGMAGRVAFRDELPLPYVFEVEV